MKRLISVSFILFYILFPHLCLGLEPFTFQNNHPTYLVNYPNWVEYGSTQGSFLKDGSIYKQWYTSIGSKLKISYSTSNDGINWNGEKLYDFSINDDIHDPSILKINSKYELFFGLTPAGRPTKIMKIKSDDGFNFDTNSISEVLVQNENWITNGVSSPTIYYENTYYLFYAGLDNAWQTGLATSNDGIHFMPCFNNPILDYDGVPKSLLKLSNTYYLFFHSANGIEYVETDKLGCDSVWKNRTVVLPYGFFPYVFQNGNELWMYYATNTGGVWRTNLAISKLTEPEKFLRPIVLIPGLFASWNKDAILHNAVVSSSEWKLNPIVREYDGMMETLNGLGYQTGVNFFIFPYDWRQNVERTSDQLHVYLNGLNLPEKPVLIGHSLGGLVGRIYAQKYGSAGVNKLITVGTPHKGTAHAYKAVESGEIDTADIFMRFAEKLVLQLYRKGLETDKQIINTYLPVLHDLLPDYSYLTKNDRTISIADMTMRNNLLETYRAGLPALFDKLITLSGNSGNTLSGFIVTERTIMDRLLDYYPDGRPISPLYDKGDGTILLISAAVGNTSMQLNKNHRTLITSREGIGAILDAVEVRHSESDLIEGGLTNAFPSLFILMLSPAKLSVQFGDKTYEETDGMVFIPNAKSGDYLIRATGREKGRYSILVGQIGRESDLWERFEGMISGDPPTSQTDSFTLKFDSSSLEPIRLSENEIYTQLNILLNDIQNEDVSKIKTYLEKHNPSGLLQADRLLFKLFKESSSEEKRSMLQAAEKIEELYGMSANPRLYPGTHPLSGILAVLSKKIPKIETYLLSLKNRGENVVEKAYLLGIAKEKIEAAQEAMKEKKYNYAAFLLQNSFYLLKSILN